MFHIHMNPTERRALSPTPEDGMHTRRDLGVGGVDQGTRSASRRIGVTTNSCIHSIHSIHHSRMLRMHSPFHSNIHVMPWATLNDVVCTAQAGIAQATFQCSGDAHFPTANSLVSKGFARATSTDVHRRRCSSHEPPSIHPFLYTFRTHTAPLLRRPTKVSSHEFLLAPSGCGM